MRAEQRQRGREVVAGRREAVHEEQVRTLAFLRHEQPLTLGQGDEVPAAAPAVVHGGHVGGEDGGHGAGGSTGRARAASRLTSRRPPTFSARRPCGAAAWRSCWCSERRTWRRARPGGGRRPPFPGRGRPRSCRGGWRRGGARPAGRPP